MDFRTKSRLSKVFASLESEGESVSTTPVGGNENGSVKVEEIRVERELALDLASMEQDITVLDQDEGAAEELATATEEIVRLGDAVESFASEGGLNRQGAQFLNLALESITQRVGLEFNIPAVESFSGSFGDRVAMTASLEAGISESLKKTWDALAKFIKEQLGKLKDFVKRLFDSRLKLKHAIKVKTEALKLSENGDKKFTVKVLQDADQAKAIADAPKLVKGVHDSVLALLKDIKPMVELVNYGVTDEDPDEYLARLGEAMLNPVKSFVKHDGDNLYISSDKTLFGSFTLGLPVIDGVAKCGVTFIQDAEYEDKEFSGAQVADMFKGAENYCNEIDINAMAKAFTESTDKILRSVLNAKEVEKGVKERIVRIAASLTSRFVANPTFIKMDTLNVKALNKLVSSVSGPVSTGVAVVK